MTKWFIFDYYSEEKVKDPDGNVLFFENEEKAVRLAKTFDAIYKDKNFLVGIYEEDDEQMTENNMKNVLIKMNVTYGPDGYHTVSICNTLEYTLKVNGVTEIYCIRADKKGSNTDVITIKFTHDRAEWFAKDIAQQLTNYIFNIQNVAFCGVHQLEVSEVLS